MNPDGHSGSSRSRFKKFRLAGLLRGERAYEFHEFYDTKNRLLRYDDRTDYLNYGYWPDGDATANPSAALVEHLGTALALGRGDVVLDVGSGLGQPAIDIVRRFAVARVIGVNRQAAQATLANERARAAGLAGVVEHRVGDATSLAAVVGDGPPPTAVMCVEALAEIPDAARVFDESRALLVAGGRIGFCDVVAVRSSSDTIATRMLHGGLAWTTSALYGDAWRTEAWYERALERAGFTDVTIERIGGRVYAPTYAHARERLPALRGGDLPRSAAALAYANLRLLEALYEAGRIEYSVFLARAAS